VRVQSVALDSAAPLAPRTPTREEPWTDRMEKLRRSWRLKPGQAFRQADWSGAKNATLGELRGDGYPTAAWQSTHARIDATERTAALAATLAPGPLFHFGSVRIDGIHRYDEIAVRNLATFRAGDVYNEKLLLDYQERLTKIGLFEGASVELDATGSPEAAPVVVKVKEQSQHQATFGIGYSANTGGRVSLEHYDRAVFGQPWISHTTLNYGSELKSIGSELTAYPDENLWRNLAANDRCVLATTSTTLPSLDIVLEGRAVPVTDADAVRRLAEQFTSSGWPLEADGDKVRGPHAPTAGPPPYRIYRIVPSKGFGLPGMHGMDQFDQSELPKPTRWEFGDS